MKTTVEISLFSTIPNHQPATRESSLVLIRRDSLRRGRAPGIGAGTGAGTGGGKATVTVPGVLGRRGSDRKVWTIVRRHLLLFSR
jgi:hypothetical protein